MRASLPLLLALAACAPARVAFQPQTPDSTATPGETSTVVTDARASGSPQEQLQQLDGVLRGQGFAPAAAPLRGSLNTNGLIAYPIDAAAGTCFTAAVIGDQPGQVIHLVVVDPLGREAGHDVRSDNHPWVSFCAAQAGRFIARVQMRQGSGGFVYTAYRGPGDRRVVLDRFFGQESTSEVQVAQMDAGTQQRLASLDGRLGQQGYRRVGEPSGMTLQAGQPRDFRLSLQQGSCYAFAALGGPGVGATTASLSDSSGSRLASAPSGTDAVVEYCAPATGNYRLSVQLVQGDGSLFTAGYRRGAPPAADTGQEVISQDSTASESLDEAFALLDADMRARGYEGFGEPTSETLAAGASRRLAVPLAADTCYAILGVGASTIQDLDLSVVDPSSRSIDEVVGTGSRGIVRVCAQAAGEYGLQVRVNDGQGAFRYAVYRWPQSTRGPFGLAGLIWVRLTELTSLLDVEGYQPDAGFDPTNGTLARQGASETHEVELYGGQCYAIVVVGGQGITDLDLSLFGEGTELATDYGTQNAFPSVRHCPPADGSYRFTVSAARGAGPYHYQVFSRPADS
jgi:hypothetical protein